MKQEGRLSARVLVWGENVAEKRVAGVAELYPEGMHEAIASAVREESRQAVAVSTATLSDPQHGLDDQSLAATDVVVWWGHLAHEDVADEVADRVHEAVLAGMGLVVLHSGHLSKPFRRLMGTTCTLRWREAEDVESVWTVAPAHPIADGIPQGFVIPRQEMYGEFFDIPVPDELVFVSSFSGGEAFRSGCCFQRGHGRIFFFGPGHETFPVYRQPEVRRVIANAVAWAAPRRDPRQVPALVGPVPVDTRRQ
jgi:trehalose utilization protein